MGKMAIGVHRNCDESPIPSLLQPLTIGPAYTLEYLDEGGANFIYRIAAADGGGLPDRLRGKLLRLRKNLPHLQSTREQLDAFGSHFKNLVADEHLIEQELVWLDHDLPQLLNASLQRLQRPPHRHEDRLPQDEIHGVLVTDMTPKLGEVLIQFKPKWLAQSPNAACNAKRCRTCALRALRFSQQTQTATDAQTHCPLNLISMTVEDRRRAAHSITSDQKLQEFVMHDLQPLLKTLKEHQELFDSTGVLCANTADAVLQICKAMTLRDCTLFLRRSGSVIEARLGDLDLKQPERIAKWIAIEESLVKGGWYTNTEEETLWFKEANCLLSR